MRTIRRDFYGNRAADVDFIFRLRLNRETRGAQHRFDTCAVRHPPVGLVVRIAVLDEVHLRIAGVVEMYLGMKVVIGIYMGDFAAATLHTLEEQKIARNMQVLKEISTQTADSTSATSAAIAKLAELSADMRKSASGFRLPAAGTG